MQFLSPKLVTLMLILPGRLGVSSAQCVKYEEKDNLTIFSYPQSQLVFDSKMFPDKLLKYCVLALTSLPKIKILNSSLIRFLTVYKT